MFQNNYRSYSWDCCFICYLSAMWIFSSLFLDIRILITSLVSSTSSSSSNIVCIDELTFMLKISPYIFQNIQNIIYLHQTLCRFVKVLLHWIYLCVVNDVRFALDKQAYWGFHYATVSTGSSTRIHSHDTELISNYYYSLMLHACRRSNKYNL